MNEWVWGAPLVVALIAFAAWQASKLPAEFRVALAAKRDADAYVAKCKERSEYLRRL